MELIKDLKYRYTKLDILSQLIVIMILCFAAPFIINTILFLFDLSGFSIISIFDVSPLFGDLLFKPWSLITYGFFHVDLWRSDIYLPFLDYTICKIGIFSLEFS